MTVTITDEQTRGATVPAPLIEISGLTKSFDGPRGDVLTVLDGIDLRIEPGEIVALLGRSGSGKSTLLRIIAGLIPASTGSVLANGKELSGANASTAMVFQSFALMPWLTVQANVELGLAALGVSPDERRRRALAAIDTIGLDGFESAYPRELSGGMRQRVGFARALVLQPDLLLMDEPFSALDVLTAENLRNELIDLWTGSDFPTKSICIVTHNIEEAVLLADRVVVLGSKPGRIIHEARVPMPRPRDRESPQFVSLVDELYGVLTGRFDPNGSVPVTEPNAVAVEATPVNRPLPAASVGGIAGLIEILVAQGGDADLPDLATTLNFEIDDLLPLVDAAVLLGLMAACDGDLHITEVGTRFDGASIQDSKEIFATQASTRAPLVRTIIRALRSSADGKLRAGFFLDLLSRGFGTADAERQFAIAVDWGRYGEMFDYDSDSDQVSLDPAFKG